MNAKVRLNTTTAVYASRRVREPGSKKFRDRQQDVAYVVTWPRPKPKKGA